MEERTSDAELVARCLSGQEAFTELYRRHAPAIYAYLKPLLRGDEHSAADALQETFLRAYRALDRFDPARPLRPWLLRIATNLALDALRKSQPQLVDTLDARPAAAPDPADAVAAQDVFLSVVRVARLAPRALAAFLLARGQGLSYREVAEVHGCSEATVKRDLAAAQSALVSAAQTLGVSLT